jgi:hypothetical protein
MKLVAAVMALLVVGGCGGEAGQPAEAEADAWEGGETVSGDGSRLQLLCLDGEWKVTVKTPERLVPPEAESQWVNRDVSFQFDTGPAQRTKGTLNENRLDLTQADVGSTVSLNYAQDVAAGLLRGGRRTLTIRTTDGAGRPKEWKFDAQGARRNIANDTMLPCPMPGAGGPAR